MKLKIKLIALAAAVILIFCIGLSSVALAVTEIVEEESYQEEKTTDLYNDEVEFYRDIVTTYCSTYAITDYVEIVLNMLSVYSATHTTDILNSSYSEYNTKYPHRYEGISDVDYSIRTGIIQLSEWAALFDSPPIDNDNELKILLEAYELQNKEYINYAHSNGGYTAQNAAEFANNSAGEKDVTTINYSFATQVMSIINIDLESADEAMKKVVELALDTDNYSANGIRAQGRYCLRFTNDVYAAAGLSIGRTDCARCAGAAYGVSNDFTNVPVGAQIYCFASQQYGHVGIYIGNGYVVHCTNYKNKNATVLKTVKDGYILKQSLSDFISSYKAACWGFAGAKSNEYPPNPGAYMTALH